MPTVNVEGQIESEGDVGKVSTRRVFRYLQIDTGPRRSPSASSETWPKQRARRSFVPRVRARPDDLGLVGEYKLPENLDQLDAVKWTGSAQSRPQSWRLSQASPIRVGIADSTPSARP